MERSWGWSIAEEVEEGAEMVEEGVTGPFKFEWAGEGGMDDMSLSAERICIICKEKEPWRPTSQNPWGSLDSMAQTSGLKGWLWYVGNWPCCNSDCGLCASWIGDLASATKAQRDSYAAMFIRISFSSGLLPWTPPLILTI